MAAHPQHQRRPRRTPTRCRAAPTGSPSGCCAAGFPSVEIWPTEGLPAVYAEWPSDDADAPTVVVYGHHDVQPVDPVELWETAPFEPLVRATAYGEELVGRGAIDDKGQVFFHVLGLAAHLATTGRTSPAVNLKVVVEGEEESGSVHFAELLRDHRDRLDCDVVVVSDTGVFGRDAISVVRRHARHGRGASSTCAARRGDLHSGSFGGAVPNPATVLARMVARLHDENGHVTLPGYYDKVVPLTDRERELLAALPFDEAAWLADAQSGAAHGEAGLHDARADLGAADRRGQRALGRLHRPGRQDDHPERGAREAELPPRRRAGPRRRAARVRALARAAARRGHDPRRHRRGADVRAPRRTPVPHPARPPRSAERHPRDGPGVRDRGALHPRGRQRPRGRPRRHPRGAGGVPRRRPARRPHPRTEREGRHRVPARAAPRRRPTCGPTSPTTWSR